MTKRREINLKKLFPFSKAKTNTTAKTLKKIKNTNKLLNLFSNQKSNLLITLFINYNLAN